MKFFFTFGTGSPLSKYYVEIEAPDEAHARAKMVCLFSSHWAGCYTDADFAAQIPRYGYQKLDVNFNNGLRLQSNLDEIPLNLYQMAYGGPP